MQKELSMYGKLVDGNLEYASTKAIIVDGMITTNPKDEDYRRTGYKLIVNNPPADYDDEKEYEPEYKEEEDKIVINYKEV